MKDRDIIFKKKQSTTSFYTFKLDKREDEILKNIPKNLLNEKIDDIIPNISENEVVRHFIKLSSFNYGVDSGLYPLGSCTMKYNPKINEKVSRLDNFTNIHPYSDVARVQGNLEIIYNLKEDLKEITGMDDVDLSPCAGAHGELTSLFVIGVYFRNRGEKRKYILIPDAAHGTNPASANVAGFTVINLKSTEDGFVDLNDLKEKANRDVAAIMLTNPNTLGLFEKNLKDIVDICHSFDIQLYYDGANLNAVLGLSRPGDTGFDIVHLNLHKTFSTPHGGGGPGSGPIGVKKHLVDFLPSNKIVKDKDSYKTDKYSKSIGRVRTFNSNFLVILRAYTYIVSLGKEGLSKVGLLAILNANYLAALLKDDFSIATTTHVMHEFVISLSKECEKYHITVMDFAKRILDYGFHAPTVSFPLIVHDCLMIEPTETESKETLDNFAKVLITILSEAKSNSDLLRNAPVNTPIKRIDDVTAARNPVLKYSLEKE